MLRKSAVVAFGVAFLFGCGDGSDGELWVGTWAGSIDCEGYVQSANQNGPVQGSMQLEGEFDSDGHLLMPAGNKKVPQKEQGQVDQWVPDGGGTSRRVLSTFQDDGDHRVYVFEQRVEQSEMNYGNIVHTSREKYDLRVDGDTIEAKVEAQYRSKGTGAFAADSAEEYKCKGSLKKKKKD